MAIRPASISARMSRSLSSTGRNLPADRSGSIAFAAAPVGGPADVAQLVERDLPKVDVASSSLVIRSTSIASRSSATLCRTVDVASSNLVIRSTSFSPPSPVVEVRGAPATSLETRMPYAAAAPYLGCRPASHFRGFEAQAR